MFEDMANQQQLEGKRLAWIARLGQLFWGLVEVAVPGSLLNLFFFHWLKILYAFEVFLIVGSILLGAAEQVQNFAWRALALTVTLNVVVLLLGDYIKRRGRWWRVFLVLVALAIVFFTVMGVSDVFGWHWKDKLFSQITKIFD
jgi:hypothetical protein